MEYASNGKGNLGVTLGAIGTGLGALSNSGLLNGLFNNNNGNSYVTKDELKYVQELAAKDSQIALLTSEQNTEVKIADVFERLITRINSDKKEQAEWNASQSVANAQMSAAIATNANSIAGINNILNQITAIRVPNTAVCPGWGNVTITPSTTTTTTS